MKSFVMECFMRKLLALFFFIMISTPALAVESNIFISSPTMNECKAALEYGQLLYTDKYDGEDTEEGYGVFYKGKLYHTNWNFSEETFLCVSWEIE